MELSEALALVRTLKQKFDALAKMDEVLELAVVQESLTIERKAILAKLEDDIADASVRKEAVEVAVKAGQEKFRKAMKDQEEKFTNNTVALTDSFNAEVKRVEDELAAFCARIEAQKSTLSSEVAALQEQKTTLEGLVRDLTGQLDKLKKRFDAALGV